MAEPVNWRTLAGIGSVCIDEHEENAAGPRIESLELDSNVTTESLWQ
jgi:hypothetical protein